MKLKNFWKRVAYSSVLITSITFGIGAYVHARRQAFDYNNAIARKEYVEGSILELFKEKQDLTVKYSELKKVNKELESKAASAETNEKLKKIEDQLKDYELREKNLEARAQSSKLFYETEIRNLKRQIDTLESPDDPQNIVNVQKLRIENLEAEDTLNRAKLRNITKTLYADIEELNFEMSVYKDVIKTRLGISYPYAFVRKAKEEVNKKIKSQLNPNPLN